MNLSEALDAALPEIPRARLTRARPPCVDPNLIVREDLLDGEPVVGVMQRGTANFFRFEPTQWELVKLFDGVRSYEEIATAYQEKTGIIVQAEAVRGFAQSMDASGFWYQTPQEKNIALSEKLTAQRTRRAQRTSKINLAHISFSAWDPDTYLGRLDRAIGGFIYNPWSVTVLVALVVFQGIVYITRWSTLGPDILLYYNFSHKGFYDIVEFWMLFLILGFLHESAHGLTCKHFGGQVHSMGLMFLFLAPCFFVDVTEGWVSATRNQRLATIIAGIWVEMTLCSLAMIVWLNTQPGEGLHDFAYQIIMLTGIALIAINLNPLIKLDGYYFLTEVIGIPDLKERSTAFLSGWFQGHILGLPVDVPVIPRRRMPLFALYAFASGLYSYLLLFAVVRFTYNLAYNLFAEFTVIPAAALAYGLFKSRLRSLRGVIGQVWSRSFPDGFRLRPAHVAGLLVLVGLLFVPLWRDRESAFFVIEPAHTARLHALVSGRVDAVLVREGEGVSAGQPLLRMTSRTAESLSSNAAAETAAAQYHAFDAQLRRQSIGAAVSDEKAAERDAALANAARSSLLVAAPAAGVVLTPDPESLRNQDVASGQTLLELAESGPRVARIYVPASALNRIPEHAEIALAPAGRFSILRLQLPPLESGAVSLPPGLIQHQDYKGIVLPAFYSGRVPLPQAREMPPLGSSGRAVIFGRRRSIFERGAEMAINLARSHIW